MDNVSEFLKGLGMDNQSKSDKWAEIIKPSQSYLIVGDVGTGKSGLAYWLLERFSKEYSLIPASVGIPRDKKELLPETFVTPDLDDIASLEDAIIFLDEAELQLPLEDTKTRQTVVNFLGLPRQRNQILLLSFHFPRLVLGRYLPYFSAFLIKRPPYLMEFAGKRQGDELTSMMKKAEERFAELTPGDIVKNTYVIAPRIRWQGVLQNPLASFWTDSLSKVWSGVDSTSQGIKYKGGKMGHSPQRKRWVTEFEIEPRPEAFSIQPIYEAGSLIGFNILDPEGDVIRKRANIVTLIHREHPQIDMPRLENAAISYFDYSVEVILK